MKVPTSQASSVAASFLLKLRMALTSRRWMMMLLLMMMIMMLVIMKIFNFSVQVVFRLWEQYMPAHSVNN